MSVPGPRVCLRSVEDLGGGVGVRPIYSARTHVFAIDQARVFSVLSYRTDRTLLLPTTLLVERGADQTISRPQELPRIQGRSNGVRTKHRNLRVTQYVQAALVATEELAALHALHIRAKLQPLFPFMY